MPDYEIRCWDASDLAGIESRFARQAYGARKWAFAADYIRLYALYHHGGIYLDADVKVFRPFDRFLNHAAFASIESYDYCEDRTDKKYDYWIDAAMLGATKGNPFIKDCLDYYRDRDFILKNGTFDQTVVCHIVADIAESRYGFNRGVPYNQVQVLKDDAIIIYPSYVFSHRRGDIRIGTHAIHMFFGGWRDGSQRGNWIERLERLAVALTNEKIWGMIVFKLRRAYYLLKSILRLVSIYIRKSERVIHS